MAPSRKSRSVNKRFAYVNEVSASKHTENANKNKQKKRKLSDMLGPQWSKQELECFYEAYRKYGKDWKKVATVVRNRSAEMVEALYSTNKAYLSLPEGAASVAGLVAMMVDHYGVLGGSDSDQESSEERGESRPQKRAKRKFQNRAYKGSDEHFSDLLQSRAVASNDGCLPLLKNTRSGIAIPAVRKRTPRIPFSFSDKDKEKYSSPAKQNLKLNMGATDDDVTHEIAMALTKASQRSGSPQVYRMASRKQETASPSQLQDGGRMRAGQKMIVSKAQYTNSNDDGCNLSFGRKGSDSGEYGSGKSYSMGRKGAVAVKFQEKGKKQYMKKLEVENTAKDHLGGIKEAFNTADGRKSSAVKRIQTEIMDGKSASSLSKGPKKKSRKSLFGDEDSSFDALQTLADMSIMMRSTNDVTESSADKEENIDGASQYELNKNHAVSAVVGTASRSPKLEKAKAGSHLPITGTHRRKPKSPMKVYEKDAQANMHPSDNQKTEATEEAKRSLYVGKRSSHKSVNNPGRHLGFASKDINSERDANDSVRLTTEVPFRNQFNLPAEARSEWNKMNIQKPLITKDTKLSEKVSDNRPSIPVPLLRNRELDLEERLSNCLSKHQARRWCTFEWFYSAIDYPWFAKSEFVEYLNHVALGHVPRLTRVEWGVIKGSLGRPRRFSDHFLKEEREKLNQYRESVRTHYTELRNGTREGLPTDLAQPLSVGQQIVAIHPRTRELHNGIVVAVDHSTYSVQFLQHDLGVELVMDIDCMPLNPIETIPASLRRHRVSVKNSFENLTELKTNEQIEGKIGDAVKVGENLVNTERHSSLLSSDNIDELLRCKEPPIHAQQPKEADILAVSELTRALDKKEAVVFELRHMNDVLENEKDGENSLKDSEAFKKQYAAVVLQLNEVNEQVSSALCCLRERNTYQRTSPPRLKPVARLNDHKGRSSSVAHYNYQECGSQVDEILESSRLAAQKVVGVAMQAISSLEKMGENWERVEEAIDYVNIQLSEEDFDIRAVRKPPTKASSEQLPTGASILSTNTTHTTNPELNSLSDQNEPKIPSELIAHCVSTLLMIQKCTERQFPPSEVARVLDSAVTSLQPLCSKNLSVYEEIQKFMGIIRTQILALIPT